MGIMLKPTREARTQMKKILKRTVAFAAAVVGVSSLANAQAVPGTGFFDWNTTTNPTPNANFTAAPFLDNNNSAQVAQVLSNTPSGRPLAVKVTTPLTNPSSLAIFNNFPIQYVFCDFEDTTAVGYTRAIADPLVNSTNSTSQKAYVGNFNFYPNSTGDTTRPGSVSSSDPNFYQNRPFAGQYADIRGQNSSRNGRTMANESLYPGSPDYKTPGVDPITTPNIRSALFTLPILRNSYVERALRDNGVRSVGGDAHIPWVSRFNNYGNAGLDNDPSTPGSQFYADAAHGTANQLPSRGDFEAQILHYRLRGADSVNLFEASAGSVIGDSLAENRTDVVNGWSKSSVVNAIFQRAANSNRLANLANLTDRVGAAGGSSGGASAGNGAQDATAAGALWSGVYDYAASSSNPLPNGRRMALVLSNLSGSQKVIDLPSMIGGFHTISGVQGHDDDYVVSAGQHRLLTFTLRNNQWRLDQNTVVFAGSDSFGSLTNRNGVGIPEPTTIGLLGIGAIGLLARRRRTA